jgi:hypothetical protein
MLLSARASQAQPCVRPAGFPAASVCTIDAYSSMTAAMRATYSSCVSARLSPVAWSSTTL